MKLISDVILSEKMYNIRYSYERYVNKLVDIYEIEEKLWQEVGDCVEQLYNIKDII